MRLRTSRHELKTITKVGIFSAICMALAVAIVVKLGNLYFGSTTGYSAMLADATGLSKGDPVKIAGIRSGTVNSIKLDHGAAKVSFSLDKGVQMRTGTQAGLRWRNVIGQKDLYIYPGNTGRSMGPGYTIPDEGGKFSYSTGDLVMARTAQPNSAGAQFFFVTGPKAAGLNSQGTYVTFGKVTQGLDIVQKILGLNQDDPSSGLGGAPKRVVTVKTITIAES